MSDLKDTTRCRPTRSYILRFWEEPGEELRKAKPCKISLEGLHSSLELSFLTCHDLCNFLENEMSYTVDLASLGEETSKNIRF